MHKDTKDIKSVLIIVSIIKCNDYSLMFRKETVSTLKRLDLIDVQQFLRL